MYKIIAVTANYYCVFQLIHIQPSKYDNRNINHNFKLLIYKTSYKPWSWLAENIISVITAYVNIILSITALSFILYIKIIHIMY